MPSKWKSAAYSALPVVFSGPSMRGVGLPMIDVGGRAHTCLFQSSSKSDAPRLQLNASRTFDFNKSSMRMGNSRTRTPVA